MFRLFLRTLLISSFISWGQTCSSLLSPVSLKEKCMYATTIIHGEIVATETTWDKDHNNIYTIATIQVYESIKGNTTETLQIATQGGTVENRIQINSNTPEFRTGNEGVFFLKPATVTFSNATNTFKLATAIQGFIKLDKTNGKLYSVFDQYSSLSNLKNKITTNTSENWELIKLRPSINRSTQGTTASPIITNFTPITISAGTKSVLTINGSNFGNTRGSVGFRDANEGGAIFTNTLDTQILNWSDTQIRIEVPFFAGTGIIRITNSTNESGTSTDNLEVPYSFINLHSSSGEAFQPLLFNNNGNGGYDLVYHEEFAASNAVPFFEESFEFWRCESGINFTFSGTTTNDTTADDGVSLIRFDNGSELEPGVLGAVITRVNGSCDFDNLASISEHDYIWNDSTNWHFGSNNPSFNEVDFKTVALHEHGHAHQLGHVIDPNAVMHFSTSSGQVRYELSDNDRDGAQFIINKFLQGSLCRGLDLMTLNEDSEAPKFDTTTLPENQQVTANLQSGYELEDFTKNIISTDNCDETVTISQSPIANTILDVDDHIITITTSDNQGNTDTYNFTVTVTTNEDLSVNNNIVQRTLKIYPNPVTDFLFIDGTPITNATLFSTNGSILREFSQNTIDMQAFSSGVYFLQINVDDKTIVQKVIKN